MSSLVNKIKEAVSDKGNDGSGSNDRYDNNSKNSASRSSQPRTDVGSGGFDGGRQGAGGGLSTRDRHGDAGDSAPTRTGQDSNDSYTYGDSDTAGGRGGNTGRTSGLGSGGGQGSSFGGGDSQQDDPYNNSGSGSLGGRVKDATQQYGGNTGGSGRTAGGRGGAGNTGGDNDPSYYNSARSGPASGPLDPTDAAHVPPSVLRKHLGDPSIAHGDHGHDRAWRNSSNTQQESFRGI